MRESLLWGRVKEIARLKHRHRTGSVHISPRREISETSDSSRREVVGTSLVAGWSVERSDLGLRC